MKNLKFYMVMVFLVLLVFASGCISTQEDQTSSDSNSSDVQMGDVPTGNMTPPDGDDPT
ncbi:hypothetical protein SAMN04488589_2067 [Methanolobus vulcani]|jgi:hypothetical protein|uniref:Uncharacterized protein n=1 Tax=Methanolobus vulcani TaxID=38026 RepID=A0A7Z7FF11_9EURY|nr:hypothetical protein [Methanolobus vulcani]SDG05769.1 hypothetical protein SAMN04488589_2067 [Methanolobus vulcani]